MGKVYKSIKDIPQCDFCESKAKYDGPTPNGPWAYVCETCAGNKRMILRCESMGTEFVAREPQPKKAVEVSGIERTENPEELFFSDRYIGCPECGEDRHVEPDADYTYQCGCGVTVKVPMPEFF
jgi:hypothetical protein